MKTSKSDRGFIRVEHPVYPPRNGVTAPILMESSAVGDYEDALENPGSSALWVGDHHHLDREHIADLIRRMQYWLDEKRLFMD